MLELLGEAGYEFEILFLDADDRVLVKRYKESRRSHPLAMYGRVDEGIHREREKMRFLKERADYIIDTSHLLTRELKKEINRIFVDNGKFSNMVISVLSFGFKYGIPDDADLVFDVRFLPNPYFIDELRPHTGMDEDVFQYVMDCQAAADFADKLEAACLKTIESGKMTKDLALITTIENPVVLNSENFIKAIRTELEASLS